MTGKKGGKSDRTYQFPAAKTSELRLNMRGANHSPFLEAAEDERRADACIGRAMADRAGKGREAGGHLGFYGEGEADGDVRKARRRGGCWVSRPWSNLVCKLGPSSQLRPRTFGTQRSGPAAERKRVAWHEEREIMVGYENDYLFHSQVVLSI